MGTLLSRNKFTTIGKMEEWTMSPFQPFLVTQPYQYQDTSQLPTTPPSPLPIYDDPHQVSSYPLQQATLSFPQPLQQPPLPPPQPHHHVLLQNVSTNNTDSQPQSQLDENTEKKEFIQSHPLQPFMHEVILFCHTEGILPSLPPPLPHQMNYSLDEFLEKQGLKGDHGANEEFREKLDQLTKAYDEELERLNLVANEFSAKLLQLLHDQAKVRIVTQDEMRAKTLVIQQKFDSVRNQLRSNVCEAIYMLQKQYQKTSTKRTLGAKATEILTQWFKNNINDPYPTEEEKSMLAAKCMVSLTQVNTWFGNNRMRFKRRREGKDDQHGNGGQTEEEANVE